SWQSTCFASSVNSQTKWLRWCRLRPESRSTPTSQMSRSCPEEGAGKLFVSTLRDNWSALDSATRETDYENAQPPDLGRLSGAISLTSRQGYSLAEYRPKW